MATIQYLMLSLLIGQICYSYALSINRDKSEGGLMSQLFNKRAIPDDCNEVCDGFCREGPECPTGEVVGPLECECKNSRGRCCINDPGLNSCSDCGGVCRGTCASNEEPVTGSCTCRNGQSCCVGRVVPPSPTKEGIGKGDPHYHTFDHKAFSFQGSCSYVLMQDCIHGDTPLFRVEVKQRGKAGEHVTRVSGVIVRIDDYVIELGRDGVLNLDDKVVSLDSLPIITHANGDDIIIASSDDGITVAVPSQFTVIWDGDREVHISIDSVLFGSLCGLLGDGDGDKSNDFRGVDGEIFTNVIDFTNAWMIPGSCEEK